MVLLLTNDDVRGLLDMPPLIEAMAQAFAELSRGDAAAVGRVDVLSPGKDDAVHGFKTMSGVALGYAVARVDSDLLRWPVRDGAARREKLGADEARIGKENGLLLLYSTASGELLGIQQDGEIQRLRVAATSALALRQLGPPAEAIRTVALFGSGYQAEAQLAGLLAVCRPEAVRVFSPRPQRRSAFVARQSPSAAAAGVRLEEASSPEAAVAGAQVVVCATNAMSPVVQPEWLRPGMHISCIKKQEVSAEALQRCDRVVVATPSNTRTVLAGVPEERVRGEAGGQSWWTKPPFDWDSLPDLADLLGDPAGTGRHGPAEITAYVGLGSGVQFAAACAMAHEAAVRDGVGRTLPDEWFLQDVPQE